MTVESLEGVDGLNIGLFNSGTFDFIAIQGDPTLGVGVPASDFTFAIDTLTGNAWTKQPGVDTNWIGGTAPGVDAGAGGGMTLPITLDAGGTCSVSLSGGSLPITLNAGGVCLAALV